MAATKPKQTLPHPKKARESAGLTYRKLASAADVSQSTISDCERSGKYPPNRHVRKAYLAALGLTEPEATP